MHDTSPMEKHPRKGARTLALAPRAARTLASCACALALASLIVAGVFAVPPRADAADAGLADFIASTSTSAGMNAQASPIASLASEASVLLSQFLESAEAAGDAEALQDEITDTDTSYSSVPEVVECGAGERIARLAAQAAGYATGNISTGGKTWPGWYPNSGHLYLFEGVGGTGPTGVYPNADIGMYDVNELPSELTELHDYWFLVDMTSWYPTESGKWDAGFYDIPGGGYVSNDPIINCVMRAAYDPTFDGEIASMEAMVKEGAYEKITTTFGKLDQIAQPGDLVSGGDGMHQWIWIGSAIVQEYLPDAAGSAVMLTASGQQGRWPNIIRSQYGVWSGSETAVLYRPTGNVDIDPDFPLAVDLTPYGIANAPGFDSQEAAKRQATCDTVRPHRFHKGFGLYGFDVI